MLLYECIHWVLIPAIVVFAIRKLAGLSSQWGKSVPPPTPDVAEVPCTPEVLTQSVVLKRSCSRERDILKESRPASLTLSDPRTSTVRSVLAPLLTSVRLPLDACSEAAADTIEMEGRGQFPKQFDLVASGGGLVAFYGGAVTSVLGTLARRGVLCVGQLHGVSSGALICATYLGVESGYTKMEDVYRCYQLFGHAARFSLSSAMRQFLDECLPPDVHVRASGRMHVTVTEIGPQFSYVPTRRVISDFPTRDDFLDTVMASTIIPGLTSLRLHQPRGRPGAYWLDGAVVKMPCLAPGATRPPRPYLKFAQLCTLARLGYRPWWIIFQRDHDFDLHLVLPAIKDVVRLLTQGQSPPYGAIAFSDSSMFPI